MPCSHKNTYRAPLWLPGSHAQSIYPYVFLRAAPPAYRRERIDTPDRDFIDFDWLDGRAERESRGFPEVGRVQEGSEPEGRRPGLDRQGRSDPAEILNRAAAVC